MRALLPLTLALGATALAADPGPLQIGELPGQKKPAILETRERNPFMRREAKVTAESAEKESEESRLREIFKQLPVTGVIRGGGEVKVLLSTLILEQGEPLPPLIEDQTEQLVVGPIDDRKVEIHFVEADESAEPRKILIPIDLRPRVAVRPPGIAPVPQPSGSDRSEAPQRQPTSP
jgi:hypothetical protein